MGRSAYRLFVFAKGASGTNSVTSAFTHAADLWPEWEGVMVELFLISFIVGVAALALAGAVVVAVR